MAHSKHRPQSRLTHNGGMPMPRPVPSLLDAMQDGNEYGSIVGLRTDNDLVTEIRRALAEIAAVRGRPCICYAANLVRDMPETAISASDHLPFCEMVSHVDPRSSAVDVLLVTPGGSAEQVNLFVEALRPRFDSVEFIIPYKAMSAGTLWSLSGNKIWMDSRAFLGPIDPQVQSKDGTWVPAQALISLLDTIQTEGQAALAKGQQPPWSYLQLLSYMDQKQLGAALSASKYVVAMASQYLERHKFRDWATHHTTNPGTPVTPEDKHKRAIEVAMALCSHDRWQAHGHAISRDVLWNEIHILIDKPEAIGGFQRAIRRAWAVLYYCFEKAPVAKVIVSPEYSHVRVSQLVGRPAAGSA
jgi:hypothetical protein